MKGKGFTKEQTVALLKESPLGIGTEGTSRRSKAKSGGMQISKGRRLKALKVENSRLKRIVVEQALDIQALVFALSKKT